jgi:hypothetical protein
MDSIPNTATIKKNTKTNKNISMCVLCWNTMLKNNTTKKSGQKATSW